MSVVSSPIPRFDFVDLTLFVNIAAEGSLTRGSERTYLSLPAASMRIKNLEETLGAKLFHRVKGGIALTEPGQVFLCHAHQVLQQIERLRGEIQPYSQGIRGQVSLFANTTAVAEFLPTIVGDFLASHYAISVDLQERLSPEIVRAVHEGVADVGLVAGYMRTDGLETTPYKSYRLVLAVPVEHSLSTASDVRMSDIMDYDFVGLERHSAINTFIEREVSPLGRSMRVRIQVGSFDAMCRMIEARVGIGILPEQAALRHAKSMRIKIVQLLDEWSFQELRVCVRRFDELPLFARELIDCLLRGR